MRSVRYGGARMEAGICCKFSCRPPDVGSVAWPSARTPGARAPQRVQRCWSAPWAWSSATSARARSTRSRRSSTRATRTRSRRRGTAVFGIVSLIFWSVTIIVTVTYVLLVMRADNDGEGGIMALITLIRRGGHAAAPRTKVVLAGARHLRRLALLRRQHDHAGDLGAVRGRGAQGGAAVARAPGRARSRRRSSSSCSCSSGSARRAVGRLFGPVMLVWFVGDRRLRRARDRRPPGGPQGALADLRARLLLQPLLDRVLRAGGRGARGHGRGGALRRHGPLRARADHARVAAARVPRLHPELPGPGRADPRAPGATSPARSSCWPPTGPVGRWCSSPRPRR